MTVDPTLAKPIMKWVSPYKSMYLGIKMKAKFTDFFVVIIILGKDESSGYLFVTEGPSFNRNEGGTTPKEYTIAIRNKDVPLQCKAVAAPLLDMAYIWTFNGLTIRFFEDEEKERQLLNKNAHGNRLSENTFYK